MLDLENAPNTDVPEDNPATSAERAEIQKAFDEEQAEKVIEAKKIRKQENTTRKTAKRKVEKEYVKRHEEVEKAKAYMNSEEYLRSPEDIKELKFTEFRELIASFTEFKAEHHEDALAKVRREGEVVRQKEAAKLEARKQAERAKIEKQEKVHRDALAQDRIDRGVGLPPGYESYQDRWDKVNRGPRKNAPKI